MSHAGIYAKLVEAGPVREGDSVRDREVLIIGQGVPRIHRSDGIPVYLVTEHELGDTLSMRDGSRRRLVAYPSDWPGPGEASGRFVYARHENLQWDGPVRVFDKRGDPGET